MPVGHLYVFFGEMSVKVFCPFFIAFFPVYGVTDLDDGLEVMRYGWILMTLKVRLLRRVVGERCQQWL